MSKILCLVLPAILHIANSVVDANPASLSTYQNLQVKEKNESSASCEYLHITQSIDHFGNHNGTFQQRFSIFTEFFEPGGPIMFFQGEESFDLDCAVR